MKCLVVMSSLPDILFFWADEEFTVHLSKRPMAAGRSQQLGEDIYGDDSTSGVDINTVLEYFLPLVASQRYMSDVNNPYCSITLRNGIIIVLDQKDDFVYLTLNGDGQESEEFLKQKLRVFRYLIGLHFGPCVDRLKPDSVKERKELWSSLGTILEMYCFLCTQQQSFLVEANEMIQVNKCLSEISISLLEKVIRTAHKEGDPQAKHALLIVNSKVLALYSSNQATKLQAPDIMMLTTLVCAKFAHPNQSIPLSVNRTPTPLAYKEIRFDNVQITPNPKYIGVEDFEQDFRSKIPYGEIRSTNLEIRSSDSVLSDPSDSYYNIGPELRGSNQSITNSDQSSKENASNSSITSEKYYTPDEEVKSFPDFFEASRSETRSSKSSRETDSGSETNNELYRQRIFLRPSQSVYVPHTVHCLQISPGTVLVIVSEFKKGELAKDMCSLIAILSNLIEDNRPLNPDPLSPVSTIEKMDGQIRRICDGFKGATAMEKTLEDFLAGLRKKWEVIKAHDIQGFLQNRSQQRLAAKLDRLLVDLMRSLSNLYGVAYCSGGTFNGPAISIHHAKALNRIQETVQKELEDYKGFLSVKAERNVTMTTYLEEFPGLVHFIYIDRTANRITAPSINTGYENIYNGRDPAHYIKQGIWDGWNYLQTFLVQGHTNISVRYGDFLYSYILWFEDSSGNQMTIKNRDAFVMEFSKPPGIIGSDFYTELKRRCFPSMSQDKIYCYELFCVHLGILPLSQVAGHCRRLAAMLWQASGEANLPMFLVG